MSREGCRDPVLLTPLFTAGANRPQKLAEAEVQGLPEHPRSSQWSLVSISRGHQKVRVRAAPEGSEEGHCPGKARGGERLRKGVRDHQVGSNGSRFTWWKEAKGD